MPLIRENHTRMQTDYHFLLDRRFCIKDQEYAVREIADVDGVSVVKAEPFPSPWQQDTCRHFAIGQVVESLIIDEEIELLEPSFANLS